MNAMQRIGQSNGANPAIANVCLEYCRRLVGRIAKAKAAILAEFHEAMGGREQLLRLALNEAEALAWQTPYPHLVFPTLATEKAQALTNWEARQRSIRPTESAPPGAA